MAYNYMTQAGYDKLVAEINELEAVHRPEISRQIAEARDKGDLSENAEYDAAKEAQGLLEGKIAQLKATLANARIIDESRLSTDSVQILTKVTIRNVKTGAELTYTLVSDQEANLKEKKKKMLVFSASLKASLIIISSFIVFPILAIPNLYPAPQTNVSILSANLLFYRFRSRTSMPAKFQQPAPDPVPKIRDIHATPATCSRYKTTCS